MKTQLIPMIAALALASGLSACTQAAYLVPVANADVTPQTTVSQGQAIFVRADISAPPLRLRGTVRTNQTVSGEVRYSTQVPCAGDVSGGVLICNADAGTVRGTFKGGTDGGVISSEAPNASEVWVGLAPIQGVFAAGVPVSVKIGRLSK